MLELKNALDRCDAAGRAFAGSQRQIQYYVNEQPARLDGAISQAFGRPFALRWASPLRAERYEEYRDTHFLQALGLQRYAAQLSDFWPSGGPRWDALARVEGDGVMLLEARRATWRRCAAEAAWRRIRRRSNRSRRPGTHQSMAPRSRRD